MVEIVIASLCSGIVGAILGAIITTKLTKKQEIELMKKKVAEDLFGYRYQLLLQDNSKEITAALNKVPIVFHKNKAITDTWYEMLDAKPENKSEFLVTLLKEVCKDVGIDVSGWNDSKVIRVMVYSKPQIL